MDDKENNLDGLENIPIPPEAITKLVDNMTGELRFKREELRVQRELELKSIELSEKESDKSFEAFKLNHAEEKIQRSHSRKMEFVIFGTLILIFLIGCIFEFCNKEIGRYIITTVISLFLGGLGGWGIAQKKLTEE